MYYNTIYDLFDVLEEMNGWSYLDVSGIKENFKKICEKFDLFDDDIKEKIERSSYDDVDSIDELSNYDPYEFWWAAPSRRGFIFKALTEIEKALEKVEEVVADLGAEYYEIRDRNMNVESENNLEGDNMNKVVATVKNDMSLEFIDSDFENANKAILNETSKSTTTANTSTPNTTTSKAYTSNTTRATVTSNTLAFAVRNTTDKTVIREGSLSRSKVFVCDKNFKTQDALNYIGDDIRRTAIVMAKNGIFEIIRSRFGIFHIKSNNVDLPARQLKEFNFEDKWFIPKPDYSLLEKLWKMNRYVMQTNNGAEFYASLFWNTEKQEYEIVVPEQTVSGASVHFEEPQDTDTKFLVIDHHSHNTMSAFFSGTDDNNDYARFKISLVMGKISSAGFETKQRVVINGLFRDVALKDIFDNVPSDELEPELQQVIRAKVKKEYYNSHAKNYESLFKL